MLPLVAGLFVLVEAVEATGLLRTLTEGLQRAASHSVKETAWASGLIVAIASNLMNSLPVALTTRGNRTVGKLLFQQLPHIPRQYGLPVTPERAEFSHKIPHR